MTNTSRIFCVVASEIALDGEAVALIDVALGLTVARLRG